LESWFEASASNRLLLKNILNKFKDMRLIRFIFYTGLILQVSCSTSSVKPEFDIPETIRSAGVNRNICKNASCVPLYQGNGRWGCAYGAYGLHDRPDQTNRYGKTQYMHLQHRVRAKFNADYLLPMAKIYWDEIPAASESYTQRQSYYDGTVQTRFMWGTDQVETVTWFDPVNRSIAGISIELEGSASDVIIEPFGQMPAAYGQILMQTSEIGNESGVRKIDIRCEGVESSMYIKTSADTKIEDNRLRICLHKGRNEILVSVNEPVGITGAQSLDGTLEWWHDKWANTGCLKIPDPEAQNMWVRSLAMFLSSCNDEGAGLPVPCVYTGNAWSYPFPQDVSYIHPALLTTGNIDIAKSWIEYFAAGVEGMKEYTKRLTGANGIFCPWVYPYNGLGGYHDPVPPNIYYYEIHNSGYLARMAYETAVFVNDREWTEKYVVPIVRETAEFYKSISTKEEDGLWHLFLNPSMGQDEMGGENQKDYLCALYSAAYCFQCAVEYGLDTDGRYRQILDGMAFPGLTSPQGFYYTSQGSGNADFGKQKHPVQLNALAYLPVDNAMSEPSRIAYDLRYEITSNAKKPYFHGWTLGTFLLAGSRYGNITEWSKDWSNLRKSDYVDPEWIQIYETSQSYGMSFYSTTNGLVAQSLSNNLVCDWYGKLEIAKCNPWQGDVYLNNIYSKLGVTVSGVINEKNASLHLKAWKDTEFELNGEIIKLSKGESVDKKQ
jgi:hypothetical protein